MAIGYMKKDRIRWQELRFTTYTRLFPNSDLNLVLVEMKPISPRLPRPERMEVTM